MTNQIQRRLHELPFMDLYVRLDGDSAPHFHQIIKGNHKGDLDNDVPEEFLEDTKKLTNQLRETFVDDEMGLTYDGVRLRASRVKTAGDQVWVAMRRIADNPPKLDQLGFMPALIPHLRKLGSRDGLILLCGATGEGKTTTSCSLLSDYLEHYGGVAFTIEDPVEYILEGRRGRTGFCYQVEIDEEKEWAAMLKRSLRWHPRYIFVGEIRTPDAANQLLRAATSGHLVITTMHAGSIEEALEGLLQLAEQAIGDRAPLLLAAGIVGIIHQTLTSAGLHARFLITEPDNPGSPLRAIIREKRIGQCRTFIDQQRAVLMRTGKIFASQSEV
jgi:twitching motility protein PilT